ncbi:MAG TPA: DNA N-6-adenine-methyltransferase [Solirubrobacteraceae bacterium]|nr:DNA N-6-adenine-methyltransferase [Solirubrobacteraceae bacterium]
MSAVRFGKLDVGSSVEWYTPPEIFEALGLSFNIDACAPPGGVPWVPAKRSFSRADDGLAQEWRGRVWVNPPYGRGIEKWMQKLSAHGDGIALVHSRTDTRWWQAALTEATAICFIRSRVRFVNGRTGEQIGPGSPMPNVLIAYGLACGMAVANSGLGSTLIVPRPLDAVEAPRRRKAA